VSGKGGDMEDKKDIQWGMLWQSPTGMAIEDVLKGAVDYFLKKWMVLPEVIYVNPGVELKSYGAIQVKSDRSMYCRGIVTLVLPKTVEIDK
jgi:hypothetical protein